MTILDVMAAAHLRATRRSEVARPEDRHLRDPDRQDRRGDRPEGQGHQRHPAGDGRGRRTSTTTARSAPSRSAPRSARSSTRPAAASRRSSTRPRPTSAPSTPARSSTSRSSVRSSTSSRDATASSTSPASGRASASSASRTSSSSARRSRSASTTSTRRARCRCRSRPRHRRAPRRPLRTPTATVPVAAAASATVAGATALSGTAPAPRAACRELPSRTPSTPSSLRSSATSDHARPPAVLAAPAAKEAVAKADAGPRGGATAQVEDPAGVPGAVGTKPSCRTRLAPSQHLDQDVRPQLRHPARHRVDAGRRVRRPSGCGWGRARVTRPANSSASPTSSSTCSSRGPTPVPPGTSPRRSTPSAAT